MRIALSDQRLLASKVSTGDAKLNALAAQTGDQRLLASKVSTGTGNRRFWVIQLQVINAYWHQRFQQVG